MSGSNRGQMTWQGKPCRRVAVLFLLFAVAVAHSAEPTPKDPKALSEAPKKPPVIVASYASVLHIRTWPLTSGLFFWAGASHLCTGVTVWPASPSVSDVRMVTTGLGRATLGQEQAGASTDCDKPLPAEGPQLLVASLPPDGISLRVRVPADLVPEAGTTVEGKIVVIVPSYEALELPLKVTSVASAGATATGWVLGIVVPALLTAGLAYFGHKATTAWTARRKEEEDFLTFKDQNFEELGRLFTNLYPTIYDSDSPDLQTLAEELRSKHFIDHIPRRIRRELETALARSDVSGTLSALGNAFSHWKPVLEAEFAKHRARPPI